MASVTNTYARAFADAVFDLHLNPASILEEVQAMAALVGQSKELRQVWEAPSIANVQKRAVLDVIVSRERFSPVVRNFLAVLIDHRRIQFLGAIVKQFELELDQRMGFAEAQIASARELTEPERRELERELQRLTGKKVRGQYSRDPALLGGALVKVGSTIYDGSVVGQLERIREQLRSA
jgi:F-type H+-transporting ATPase subunit delta